MASNYYQSTAPEDQFHIPSMISSMKLTHTSFPPRPNPTGSLGESECLYTNHFTCSFADNIPLYQYDVSIEEIFSNHNDNWYEIKGRARCALIIQSFIFENQLDPNIFVWYDEQKCLYSTSYLLTPEIRISKDGRNRLNIKSLTNQWSTNDIHKYINGQTKIYPFNAVRILETLLKRSIQNQIEVINNKCYFKNKELQILDNGFEKRHGFIQSLHLSSNLLTLNIQTKLTLFYSNISLIEFIHKQIGRNQIPSDNDYKNLNKILNNCLIVTQQSKWKKAYEFERFDHRKPGEIYIESGQSLIEYFQKKNIILTQTNYPCIQVHSLNDYNRSCHLPLELCRIKECQIYDNSLSQTQEGGKQIPTPKERYNEIMNTLEDCHYNSNLLCRTVGFHIDDKEMLEFDARILSPPEIILSPNYQARVSNGRIPLDGHLFNPKSISTLAITYFGINFEQNKNFIDQFMDNLVNLMKDYNIYGRTHEEHIVKPYFEDIDGYFSSMNKQKCQFIICIMDAKHEDDFTRLKNNIKKCGTILYGIMTQCVIFSEIPKDKSIKNYCENLIRKINFKNDGINFKINLNIALKNKKLINDSFMFFGADVIHSTNVTFQHPSIAAIVGSGNSSCSTTAVRVCKQYSKEDKCSIEIILGMKDMIEQLLDYNYQINHRLPTKIIFYRDGVDDGQFEKIFNYEISAIRQAFNKIYGNESKHPRLTFIIVKKRHNTRFFTYNQNSNQRKSKKILPNQTNNMSIGAVIDTTIVHPYENNFYLNSHNAYQGVNHPSLYHVLLDEIEFTANELQLLTYHLCFTDPRSSASEAIPSVVHQADIAALKARDLFYNDDDSSIMDVSERKRSLRNPIINNLNYEILNIHKKLINRPVFG